MILEGVGVGQGGVVRGVDDEGGWVIMGQDGLRGGGAG